MPRVAQDTCRQGVSSEIVVQYGCRPRQTQQRNGGNDFCFIDGDLSDFRQSRTAGFAFGLRVARNAAVIGLQMASAYVGSTFMPMIFGQLQQHIGIGFMPLYLLVFLVMNLALLEAAYRRYRKTA